PPAKPTRYMRPYQRMASGPICSAIGSMSGWTSIRPPRARRAAPRRRNRAPPLQARRGAKRGVARAPGACRRARDRRHLVGRGLVGRKHLAQRERDAGPGGLERVQQARKHPVIGERDEADAQPTLLASADAACLLRRALELRQDAARLL